MNTPLCAKSANAETEPLQGRMDVTAPASTVGEFMFMPAGVQVIHATKGVPGQRGKDITAHVLVERGAESHLQQQLAAINARGGDKVYFDFNHEDRDASFWPQQFVWRESPTPGVYVAGEWSASGRQAIEGKTYRSFSPVFHVDDDSKKPCRVACNTKARPNMGGLVNNPAFKNNLPLWAKHAGANQQTTQKNSMTPTELAALQAKIATLEQEIAGLVAGSTGSADDAEAIQAKRNELNAIKKDCELEEMRAKQASLEQQLLTQRTKDADDAVKAAVRRGAIPTKDEALQAAWKKACIEDVNNIALLAKIPGSSALMGSNGGLQGSPARLTINSAVISRESNEAVLGRMSSIMARQAPQANLPYNERPLVAKELAGLYAKEILPRLAEGDDIPLSGSNSLGTLAQSLTAIRTLELLTLNFPILQSIMTDFSDQIVSYGDTLTSRYRAIPAVQTYNTSTGWPTNSDHVTVDVAMTYNQWKGVPIIFQAHELAGTLRRLFDEVAPGQAYALGKDIVDYIYALITAAYTNTVTAAGLGTFGRATMIDVGGVLDDVGNPDIGRFAILARPYYSALAKDNILMQLAAFQKAEVITQRLSQVTMPDVEGFMTVKAVNLPATSIAGKTLKGFFGTKSSIALATRLSADYVNAIPGAGNGNLAVVTTPGGFSANLVQFVSHTGAYAAQRMDVIYAGSRGQLTAGALLTDV